MITGKFKPSVLFLVANDQTSALMLVLRSRRFIKMSPSRGFPVKNVFL